MQKTIKDNNIISRSLSIFVLLILLFSLFVSQGPSPAGAQGEDPNRPTKKQGEPTTSFSTDPIPTDRIIVKFKKADKVPQQDNSERQELMKELSQNTGKDLTYVRAMSDGANVLALPEKLPYDKVVAIAQTLMARDDVEYAEPDMIRRHTLVPNDPLYGNQWHYTSSSTVFGINLPAAWDITTGSADVVVAVIDTGITNHPDLNGKVVPGYDFIHNSWVANDGDGRDSDPSDPGDWVAANECGYTHPGANSSWHGTHVAGTIGASTNNSLGVAGVSWGAKILPVRVLGKCGGYDSDIIDGMYWAAGLSVTGVPANANPAQVLNLSLGGYGTCPTSYQNAINAIRVAGATIVVAAGNDDNDASLYTPAGCSGVITVGATDIDGWITTYSNYGTTLEISAPGGDFYYDSGILSTLDTGTTAPVSATYAYYQGTSMAAPHVSGVIALMLSLDPTLSPDMVLAILQTTARSFGQLSCNTSSLCGVGIVDATAALSAIAGNIDVTIGGDWMDTFTMGSPSSRVEKYGVDGGPVVISSSDGAKIIASLNQWRRRPNTPEWTGVAQSMALPVDQISNIYVMPRYDYSNPSRLYNTILIANVDTVERVITVTIGGTEMGQYTLGPSESEYVLYRDLAGGPVVVSSDEGAKIIASLYELRRDPSLSGWNGQSEMMGLPGSQLSDKYIIPVYFGAANPNTLDARLFIANADNVTRDITVSIGGTVMGTYTLLPNTNEVLKYAIDGGPVEISSDPGAKIIASLNQWRRRPNTPEWTGVAQSMALPVENISNIYVIPRYDYSNPSRLYNTILIANVDIVTRVITVTIGGTVMGQYTLGPSESQYVLYRDLAGGPVVVSSDEDAKIIASLYELRRDPSLSGWNGQSEMMGLPWSQLSDQYLIPQYFGAANPNTLDARLFIGVP